jgi:hypothetical protein
MKAVATAGWLIVLSSLFLAGCGKNELKEISGVATYGGAPIADGKIRLLPIDGAGPTAGAAIVDGRYSAKISPGKKRVEIESFRIISQHHYNNDPKNPMVSKREQLLPERYNAKSELTCEITDGGTQDFALEK